MSNQLLLILLAFHVLICLLFFGINIAANGLQDSIYKLIIIFFMPVLGLAFFMMSAIIHKTIKRKEGELEDYLKTLHSYEHVYQEESIDFEREINTVPLRDMLQVDDASQKRDYLIYILKKDFSGHINGLQHALKSDDSETSHYASAALMEIKSQFESMIQNAEENYRHDSKNQDVLKEYIAVLKKYLISKLADSIDYYDFQDKYAHALAALIENFEAEKGDYTEKISADIFLDDYESAARCCSFFIEKYPDSEEPYIAYLKLNYALNDFEAFSNTISELRMKKITISDELEDMVGYWERSKVCL